MFFKVCNQVRFKTTGSSTKKTGFSKQRYKLVREILVHIASASSKFSGEHGQMCRHGRSLATGVHKG